MAYILARLVSLGDFFFPLSFAITGRVRCTTQLIFRPNKRECKELINLKQAFPPLKRSVPRIPRHQPPSTYNFCQIL